MKRHFLRRPEPRGDSPAKNRDELIPALVARHGLRMLDNVHRCRETWAPRRIR